MCLEHNASNLSVKSNLDLTFGVNYVVLDRSKLLGRVISEKITLHVASKAQNENFE